MLLYRWLELVIGHWYKQPTTNNYYPYQQIRENPIL